jgi:hypothetical protein
LSVISISTAATTSFLPVTKQDLPEMGIKLWHARSNLIDCVVLTALVVATILTVVSLGLRRYVKVIFRDWWIEHLQLMAQEDSTETLKPRNPKDTYLSHHAMRKLDDDESDTDNDQRSTSSEEDDDEPKPNFAQILLDKIPMPRAF